MVYFVWFFKDNVVLLFFKMKIPRECKVELEVGSTCKLTSLDRFSSEAVMPKYMNKQWACANGDWITMVGECNWELVNVYTHHKIPLPVLPFVGTWWLDTFMYNEHLMVLKKIAICKVTTAAGRYQDFSFLPLSLRPLCCRYWWWRWSMESYSDQVAALLHLQRCNYPQQNCFCSNRY
jgi:hypothetical protein